MSKEYIDKAAFIEYLGFENTTQEREENIGEIVTLEDFDRQPVADVVEVVRCKDCKHKKRYDVGFGGKYIVCGYDGADKGDMEFCNRGEKKNEDE